jgi:hypothetical protein
MDQPNQQSLPVFSLSIDAASKSHLIETAKWTKLLAIAGFIFIGLMVAYGIAMPSIMERSMSKFPNDPETPNPVAMFRGIMTVYMLVFATIYFFPCFFTLRFSNALKAALNLNDQDKLVYAFQNLKITARYLGILAIIGLVLAALGFLSFLLIFSNMPDFKQ